MSHLQPDLLLLLVLLPIAGIIIGKEENIKINKKKLYAGFFIILLLAVTPSFSFNPAHADNSIRQIVKLADTYPAGVAFFDVPIDPPLLNINKAFVFFTVSHTGENDASDTFRSVEILDLDTLRLKGESTASGNNAVDFIAYIIEYDALSDVSVQHLQETINLASTATEVFTIPTAINTTNSMLISRGQHMNFSETSIGDEEMERKRILTSTTWEYFVANDINTEPEGTAISIVDWNQGDIFVQRAIGTLVSQAGDQTVTVVPVTAIDPTRTMLLVTYAIDGGTSIDEDDLMVQASLTNGGNIVFHRADADGDVSFTYELIEFPSTFAKITHFNTTIPNTSLTSVVTVTQVKDFSKTMAISTVGSPFGYSTGAGDELAEVLGGIDRTQATFKVLNNTRVELSRDDSTGETIIAWQLVEFFETDVAENAQGTNQISQIVKLEGAYTGVTASQDFTISPALSDVSKSMLFVTISDNAVGSAQVAERMKRFFIKDTTTLTISGTAETSLTNSPINFTATIIEFGGLSPIFQQFDQVQYPLDINSGELILHMSPINTTGSHIMYNGWTSLSDSDTTIGKEEFAKLRIINSAEWGYDIEDRNEPTVAVANIIDWNQNDISIQTGTASLSGTTLTVSPPTDVIRNQTILLVTHIPSNDEFNDEPDDAGLLAFLDGSVPPDIIFERTSAVDLPLIINWQLISFPTTFASIQHQRHSQLAGVSNATETVTAVGNFSNAFAIGTVQTPIGHANGKGSFSTDDNWGEVAGQLTLEDTTTVRFERGLSVGSWELGFQVVEFLSVGILSVEISDTVTVAPDDPDFTITKIAVDIGTSIDLSTNKNITKLGSDIASAGDTVNANAIFVIELNDQGEAIDVLSIDITKLALETVGSIDQTNLAITKALQDSVTVNDQVITNVSFLLSIIDTVSVSDDLRLEIIKALTDLASTSDDLSFDIDKTIADITIVIDQADPELIAQILELDTVTANDEVRLTVLKAILDTVLSQDEINFVVNKLLQDSATISDLTDTTVAFGLDELDTITTNDLVILDITKQLFDVASAIDDLNLEATKVFLDTTVLVDQSQTSTDTDVDETDIVTVPDDFVIDVTKLIQDISTIQDEVVLVRLVDLAILDTVLINDPNVFFTIATVIPNGTGTPAGSGGSIPSGTPFFQRLVGLSITSELFFIAPADRVPSDFIIETFGNENLPVIITNIQATQEFASWFEFSSFPDTLLFDTTVDTSRTFSDPARFKNSALDDFVLSVPSLSCEDLDPFASQVPCIDPIIYEAPVTFTFTKGGVEFRERHIVTIDATQPVICDALCELVEFMIQNYWWLAGIVIVFMMMYFLGVPIITGKRIRTVRRVDSRHFESFDAERPRRKFKRGKRG